MTTTFNPRLMLLLALAAPLRASDSPARPLTNITFDEDYDLFYQEPFHRLLERAKRDIPHAYKSVITQWGLPDTGGLHHPLTIQIKELPSETLRRWEAAYVRQEGAPTPSGRRGSPYCSPSASCPGAGDQLRQFLVIDIGTYVQHHDEDLESVLTHEMAHAILADVETGAQAAPIPAWFNEGLAQSVTLEGWERVQEDIAELHHTGYTLRLCDLDGPVDEFAHGPFNANCYPEFYLAVQRLKQLGGPQTLSRVIAGLHNGTKLPDLLPSVTGMDMDAFKKDVGRYAGEIFAGIKPIP